MDPNRRAEQSYPLRVCSSLHFLNRFW